MAKPEFIGIGTLQTLANNLHKDLQMSGAYYRDDVLTRLGISVISGIQFQDTKNILHRKGGTSRKKVVGNTLNNAIGYIEERKLVTTKSWSKFLDNANNYREVAVVDDKGQFSYPLSETAIRAIGTTYGEDIIRSGRQYYYIRLEQREISIKEKMNTISDAQIFERLRNCR